MNPERIIIVNGSKIEEFYWHGKYVVYKNMDIEKIKKRMQGGK